MMSDEVRDPVHELWTVHAEILQKRGYNLDELVRDWAQKQAANLSSPGAQTDFKELCANGCVAPVLSALVVLLKWSPRLETFWEQIYGNPDKRRKVVRSLEKTSSELERLFSFSIALEDAEMAAKFGELGRISPSRLVGELRFYARMLDFMNRLPKETNTRSLTEFSKFLLTDYVKATTGRFRDRNVSALLGETTRQPDYNEVAHRMWRHRNFARMKSHYSRLGELLLNIGRAVSSRT
jgi:hypothetical protein